MLVIDDSAFTRQTIKRILEKSPLVEVVAWARDGEEALHKALELEIDLITLDLEMPRMDGFTFLRLLMAKKPTPVIVISGKAGDQDVFKALDLGAVDFVAKPSRVATTELESIEQELIRKVHGIRQLRIDRVAERMRMSSKLAPAENTRPAHRVVAIGSSTGGPAALMHILSAFETPPPCAFIVSQHMPEGFTRGFAERIDRLTAFRAREAETGDVPSEGSVLVAPGGKHLEFEQRGGGTVVCIRERVEADRYAPSVDRMFLSAAKQYGSDLLAVVLTGMGDDGSEGVEAVKQAGGNVIVESEETAVIFGMPQQAIRAGSVDAVLPLSEIAPVIRSGFAPGADGKPGSEA